MYSSYKNTPCCPYSGALSVFAHGKFRIFFNSNKLAFKDGFVRISYTHLWTGREIVQKCNKHTNDMPMLRLLYGAQSMEWTEGR